MTDKELIEKARAFAALVHKDSRQNDAEGSLRFPHYEEVARLVADSGGSAVEVAAAWLHDSVEDTPTTIEDVTREFGDQVAEVVGGLTDLPEFVQLPITERKAKQAERLRSESNSVRRVKLADQSSNVLAVGKKVFLDLQGEQAILYCKGAKSIADICKGVSPFLDRIFEERYETALKNLTEGIN